MFKKRLLTILAVMTLAMVGETALAGGKGSNSSNASEGDYRSAKTGQYVKKAYAEKHKSTTVREARQKK
jgi:hypothetical protein